MVPVKEFAEARKEDLSFNLIQSYMDQLSEFGG